MHFQQADVLADARPLATAEGHEAPFHFGLFFFRPLRPTFGHELVDVIASTVDSRVFVDDRRIASYDGSGWEEMAAKRHPTGRDDSFEDEACGRVDSKGFFDHRAEIGQVTGLAPLRQRGQIGSREFFL